MEKNAAIIASALKPDDAEWTKAKSEGAELVLEVKTPKIGAMLNAYDDYFLNLIAARSILQALGEIDNEWMVKK